MKQPSSQPKRVAGRPLDSLRPVAIDIRVAKSPAEIPVLESEPEPEVVVHDAEPAPEVSHAEPAQPATASPLKPVHWWQIRWWRSHPRASIGAAVAIVLLAAGAGIVGWQLTHVAKKAAPVAHADKPKPPPPPTPVYSPLTGLPVTDQAAAQQPVVGVMIENLYPNARPQSGLGQAGVVYEALAEGGITRFLAIFQEPLPALIGPVRSLRPYYLDWGLEYNIPVAHAGGSQPALAGVPTLGLKDINALRYDGSAFYRASDRYAPHNLYTTDQRLANLLTQLGFATAPDFAPAVRKADKPQSPAPHPTIHITFSGAPYNVEYNFDAASDSYDRVMGGVPHIERNTNQQIKVKNVIVEFVPTSYGTQEDGKPETIMQLVGSGSALVFDDGTVTSGSWSKSSDKAPTQLLDASGKPIPLNRGNTWFEVVPAGNTVTY